MKKLKLVLCLTCLVAISTGCGNSTGVSTKDVSQVTDSAIETDESEDTETTEITTADGSTTAVTLDGNSSYNFTYYTQDNPEVEYNIEDCVKLGKYKGIDVETSSVKTITKKIVDDYIVSQLQEMTITEDIKRKTIKKDDYLRVTREDETDSELFSVADSGKKNIKKLVKAKVGDTVTITSTEDNETTYTFEINNVLKKIEINSIADVTDDLVKKNSSYKTLKQFERFCKRYLVAVNKNTLSSECMDIIVNNSEINVPDGLVDYYKNIELADIDYTAATNGYVSFETYIVSLYGMTVDDFLEELETSVEAWVDQQLICEAIQAKEKLEDSDSEYKEYCNLIAQLQGYSTLKALYNAIGSKDALKEDYSKTFKQLNFVMKNANIIYSD
jgi:hypothetical protein